MGLHTFAGGVLSPRQPGQWSNTATVVSLPHWVDDVVAGRTHFPDRESQMRLAIELSRVNVDAATGGPFGAAIFDKTDGGRLISVGVNRVVPLSSSLWHAEALAFLMAQQELGNYTLQRNRGETPRETVLATSSQPCVQCWAMSHWSGISEIVYAARATDAQAIGFDEGPIPHNWIEILAASGIIVTGEFMRDAAVAVQQAYKQRGGVIYNRDGEAAHHHDDTDAPAPTK